MSSAQRSIAADFVALSLCNPFLPERIEAERKVLGPDFVATAVAWNLWPTLEASDPNVAEVERRAAALVETLRDRLAKGDVRPRGDELQLYQDLVVFVLYYRYSLRFAALIGEAVAASRPTRVKFYVDFKRDAERLLIAPGLDLQLAHQIPHLFACFYQVRRAFYHVFYFLVGASRPTARLRAAVWQSIFSHDLRRYRHSLHARMADFATLITGPSGTGKELVARAIGLSRYIPFLESEQQFGGDFFGSFQELNLTALAPGLIESELFGHQKGAFTGATTDRVGWLETCPPLGTIFLDEIGDLDPAIQVKLLRVLQNRTFQRAGDTKSRQFQGKVIAATNRDVAGAMARGTFREDLYYRLCGDQIELPSLHERLRDDPGELHDLLRFLAHRIVGDEAEAVVAEVEAWIEHGLGRDYAWPGNVRELEQCLRNVLLRHEYRPRHLPPGDSRRELSDAMQRGALTAGELLHRYAAIVFEDEGGNLEATARRLDLDRRTVRRHLEAGAAASPSQSKRAR